MTHLDLTSCCMERLHGHFGCRFKVGFDLDAEGDTLFTAVLFRCKLEWTNYMISKSTQRNIINQKEKKLITASEHNRFW